ncbi:MAG: hypothetical protein NZ920_03485 [Aigarchaeota archaeon]|nr:hypothetical protein [Aigarchaeota archaeon]MDW8092318.1 hypothetical protein [Nitrososphaerota archaeon]
MQRPESFIRIEVDSLEDLAMLASMLPIPHLNYDVSGRVLYLLLVGPSWWGLIYYYRLDADLNAKFLQVDKFTGKVTTGDKSSIDPSITSIAIIRVRSQEFDVTKGFSP